MKGGESVNIKKHRELLEMSQAILAAKMETTTGTISRWENGVRNPDPDTIVRLASVLNCTTDQLLGLNPPLPSTPNEALKEGERAEEVPAA